MISSPGDRKLEAEVKWFEENRDAFEPRLADLVDELWDLRRLHRLIINRYLIENQDLIAKLYGNPDAAHDRQQRQVVVQHGLHQQIEDSP
jgi:hypothetical protein